MANSHKKFSQEQAEDFQLDSTKNHVIRDLDQLNAGFQALHATLQRMEYFKEYERLRMDLYAEQHGVPRPQSLVTSAAFNRHIVLPFVENLTKYRDIKSKLLANHYLFHSEIESIEHNVLKAANLGEDVLASLQFFPEFQRLHIQGANQHKQTLLLQKEAIACDILRVSLHYANQSRFFKKMHLGTSLLCVIGVGLPFLLGGLMAHLITKLSTRAKLSQLAKTKLEKEIQINQNIHPEIQGLRDEIQMNEALVIKQGFFAAAKARHQERMMQVEKFIRKGVEL